MGSIIPQNCLMKTFVIKKSFAILNLMPAEYDLTFSFVKTIRDIPKESWDSLFKDTIEGYGFQQTLEEANLKEFSLGYLLAWRGQKLKGIIPFFIMDFSFATLVPGIIREIILFIQKYAKSFLRRKIMFLGSSTAEEFYLALAKDENAYAFISSAIQEISTSFKKEKIWAIVFNNLSKKYLGLAGYLKKNNFIEMETLPSTIIEIKTGSLEEYISGLSHNMRKDLKRKLKKSSQLVKLKTVMRQDIEDIAEDVYRLYLNNFNDSDVQFEILTIDFFKNICRNMEGIAKYFITYADDKIVAFNLCFIKDGVCIDKFIGFDYSVALKYHLYFTTFCHNIDWCIKNKIRYYQPGTTDYYPKVRLGAKLIPLYIYSKASNSIIHAFMKSIARFIQPKNIDSSLKNLEKVEEFKY